MLSKGRRQSPMKATHIRRICARPEPRTRRKGLVPRSSISAAHRRAILKKTGGLCHICGDRVGRHWDADHVMHHQLGGESRLANYFADLPGVQRASLESRTAGIAPHPSTRRLREARDQAPDTSR
jgi:5-methylcytosine-specific restriction endonuclease McrA